MTPSTNHRQQSSGTRSSIQRSGSWSGSGRSGGQRRYHNHGGLCCRLAAAILAMFLPLGHPPGHVPRVDFGETVGRIERKIHFFVLDLLHSDAASSWLIRRGRPRPYATGTRRYSSSSPACRSRSCTTPIEFGERSACQSAKFHCL